MNPDQGLRILTWKRASEIWNVRSQSR